MYQDSTDFSSEICLYQHLRPDSDIVLLNAWMRTRAPRDAGFNFKRPGDEV